jgi:hypothetical protein
MKRWTLTLALFCLSVTLSEAIQVVDPYPDIPACWALYSVPYIDTSDPDASSVSREIPTSSFFHELRALGIAHMITEDVPGNRFIACVIAGHIPKKNVRRINALLYSIGQATKINEATAREIFNAPFYEIYFDYDLERFLFHDGREGRELRIIPFSSERLYFLYDKARAWKARCGVTFPLPAGC